ncbi:helix-turn-helix domain-containing protein [Paenibacillus sp. 2TAB19]|uniref:helix-turn-helix domain-containing protein n=1 Tax=Paenibacillus sp. 2TAB19 TaxID=3233003 RepID=UPI003F9653A3
MGGFGSVLKSCRERAGLSQERLAELLNRSRSCISKFEKEHKVLNMYEFRKWIECTNANDVASAFIQGFDPVTIMQTVLQVAGVA